MSKMIIFAKFVLYEFLLLSVLFCAVSKQEVFTGIKCFPISLHKDWFVKYFLPFGGFIRNIKCSSNGLSVGKMYTGGRPPLSNGFQAE